MALHRMSFRLRQTLTHARWLHTSRLGQQQEALVAEPEPEPFSVFRTQQNDPACQSEKHIGQFYTIPSAHTRTLFPHGLPRRYQQQVKTFTEAAVMVRQPALEVISYLKETDMSKPVQRYMFYGLKGGGKTLSLCHVVHFCFTQGWLVLHIPDAHSWVKNCKELLRSSFNASRLDQPLQATEWLRNFKITNEPFLSKLKTTQRYVWTKRELTEEGRPLGELVDQGITRVKSSSDVVGALMKELRQQSGQPGCDFRLAVAVDGVNALWGQSSMKKEDKSEVNPDELTLIYNLRKMMRNDWTGGAIITTLSHTGAVYPPKLAYLPQDLMGERGFDNMDPFIPVSVPCYSEKEFESCYLYYMDRNWLQHPMTRSEEGKKELIFMTDRIPSLMERICAFL
ncbi:28S ribosomal protein S29, mitochondrial [Syngnathus typhle]|uniref:28S ribosomal protein S29, mitochondrial n=1 Tax=Syngnathus typhle TaxID=161592 RepID=UPI002A6AEAE2|nr:28S ribosomal protein S29, mitochondrial [Syngnathus typhle]XP_061144831.1 28S ribosomal protein S29, mitochondrial [Syngnathus typhle]